MEQWLALIDTAAAMRERHEIDLVVIDSLAHFLPAHSENSASALFECLTPLQRLATAGMSVLLPHHPRKGKTVAGQAARGSGALPGFVDIIIEMGYYGQPDDLDRRRRLIAFSRHEQTQRHLLMELLADGADYVLLHSGVEAAFGESWQAVLHILTAAAIRLTRQEILENWPPDYDKPDATTLWRWLSRAVAQGQVRQNGTGRPNDPFRYWLSARQEMMRPDGGTLEELQAWNDRCLEEMFANLEAKNGAKAPVEAPPLAGQDLPAMVPVVAAEETPATEADAVAAAPIPPSPSPSPEAEPAAPVAPEAPVRIAVPVQHDDSRQGSRFGLAAGSVSRGEKAGQDMIPLTCCANVAQIIPTLPGKIGRPHLVRYDTCQTFQRAQERESGHQTMSAIWEGYP